MRLDWLNVIAILIFLSITVTLIVAVSSYFAYKLRERIAWGKVARKGRI